jgi:hypothetical protein
VTGERLPGGRFEPDGDVHGCATRRLAEVVPQLPPARREDYWPVTGAELAEWQRRWEQANTPAAMRRAWKRQLRESLPRRVRARLWLDMRIDDAASWLAEHGHERACVALWRVTGLWG